MDVDREEAPHRSRKDRTRWCRGKVGIKHELQHAEFVGGFWQLHTDRCVACGKKFLFKGTACRAQASAPPT